MRFLILFALLCGKSDNFIDDYVFFMYFYALLKYCVFLSSQILSLGYDSLNFSMEIVIITQTIETTMMGPLQRYSTSL